MYGSSLLFGDYNGVRKRDNNKITGATEFLCKSFKFMDFFTTSKDKYGVFFLDMLYSIHNKLSFKGIPHGIMPVQDEKNNKQNSRVAGKGIGHPWQFPSMP